MAFELQTTDHAARVEAMKARLMQPTGRFIKIKNRKFTDPDGLAAPKFEGIIVDFMYVNTYYDKPYNPADEHSAPACYSMSIMPDDAFPADDAPVPQDRISKDGEEQESMGCKGCWANQYGSDPVRGKGKACTNRIVVAMVSPDLDDDSIRCISLAPTSIKAFSAHCRSLARSGATPDMVITEFSLDEGSDQPIPPVLFKAVNAIDEELFEKVQSKRAEVMDILTRAPDVSSYVPPAPMKSAKKRMAIMSQPAKAAPAKAAPVNRRGR